MLSSSAIVIFYNRGKLIPNQIHRIFGVSTLEDVGTNKILLTEDSRNELSHTSS